MMMPANPDETKTATTRDDMSKYWEEHAASATVESMMLDDNAGSITASDMEEVLAMLPPYEDAAVCEIGAGIGRFTGYGYTASPRIPHPISTTSCARSVRPLVSHFVFFQSPATPLGKLPIFPISDRTLALLSRSPRRPLLSPPACRRLITEKKVKSIHVSDFMETYIEANRAANGHHAGTSFACEDVTKQDFGTERYDHVFSNWLFMYLDDAETAKVFARIFDSLKPGGTFFMRESCFRQSGNKKRSFNPTKYRSDELYESLIEAASRGGFTIEQRAASETYIQIKNNENQLMWLFRKDLDATNAAAAAPPAPTSLTPAASLVDASRVYVKNDEYGGAGCFASVDMAAGTEVERGIVRVLTNCDGNENPYVFTWSDELPNTTWALGSGCSTFYNTTEEESANTHMIRDFANKSFSIVATRDLKAHDELLHVYKSKKWRTCFKVLNEGEAGQKA